MCVCVCGSHIKHVYIHMYVGTYVPSFCEDEGDVAPGGNTAL